MLDTSYHKRRVARELEDPEYRAAYERTRRELQQVNEILGAIESLRQNADVSKAALARQIGKNDAAIRRLLTTEQGNPELRTVVAMATALDAEVRVVPRRRIRRRQLVPAG